MLGFSFVFHDKAKRIQQGDLLGRACAECDINMHRIKNISTPKELGRVSVDYIGADLITHIRASNDIGFFSTSRFRFALRFVQASRNICISLDVKA